MTELASTFRLQVLVVGGSSDDFVRGVMNLLDGNGIDYTGCADVYSAVVRMARGAGGVVIGHLGELGREQGRLFDIARENGFACCCFADKDLASRPREILAAIENGAFVVAEVAQVENVLMELSGGADDGSPVERHVSTERTGIEGVVDKLLGGDPAEKSKALSFLKDEFATTKAELDALLGA